MSGGLAAEYVYFVLDNGALSVLVLVAGSIQECDLHSEGVEEPGEG